MNRCSLSRRPISVCFCLLLTPTGNSFPPNKKYVCSFHSILFRPLPANQAKHCVSFKNTINWPRWKSLRIFARSPMSGSCCCMGNRVVWLEIAWKRSWLGWRNKVKVHRSSQRFDFTIRWIYPRKTLKRCKRVNVNMVGSSRCPRNRRAANTHERNYRTRKTPSRA